MCGIFGVIAKDNYAFDFRKFKRTLIDLFLISESRGQEAAGIAVMKDNEIVVVKQPVKPSAFICSRVYSEAFLTHNLDNNFTAIGHTRLVTDGIRESNQNNQPVIKCGMVGVHNGIVVNVDKLWGDLDDVSKESELDSEVILALLLHFKKKGHSPIAAVRDTFKLIYGATSIAVLTDDSDNLALATNNGSLYICYNSINNLFIFTSELHFIKQITRKAYLKEALGQYKIEQVGPGSGYMVSTKDLEIVPFLFNGSSEEGFTTKKATVKRDIRDVSNLSAMSNANINKPPEINRSIYSKFQLEFERNCRAIDNLRRCTKCLLPETMPFISFDTEGVCSYCSDYNRISHLGIAELEKVIAPFRKGAGNIDCIVGISGGRDSTYGLHYINNELKLNPIAYTYDWGMITDLARRNISRICGKLGVEHILVSADITVKRSYIRSNVSAWLKKPSLGMIPLFMAGDKQYFYYLNRLKKQNSVRLAFLCENLLERTDFKTGFSGIYQGRIDKDRAYTLSLENKVKIALYYMGQYLLNPRYFNYSLLDTLSAYFSYYLMEREYYNIYRFIPWNEQEIIRTLRNEYDWELAPDTKSTWRIGDGTASFYNYIYYTVAGFSEIDTFRSNQIREGMLNRNEALALAYEENKPRFDSIQWYCRTIGLDFFETMNSINSIPKLYHQYC